MNNDVSCSHHVIDRANISALLLNCQSLNDSTIAEITCVCENYQPDLLFFTETWLNPTVKSFDLPGYSVAMRRDRDMNNNDVYISKHKHGNNIKTTI